jgi:hypothetical protein
MAMRMTRTKMTKDTQRRHLSGTTQLPMPMPMVSFPTQDLQAPQWEAELVKSLTAMVSTLVALPSVAAGRTTGFNTTQAGEWVFSFGSFGHEDFNKKAFFGRIYSQEKDYLV